MENRERYKRMIMFLASAVIIAIETLLLPISGINFMPTRRLSADALTEEIR